MGASSLPMAENRWTVIVAQKDLQRAKSRLHAPHHVRVDLAKAMLLDTVDAILGCQPVEHVVLACERLGNVAELDLPRVHAIELGALGYNASLEASERWVRRRFPDEHVAALPADLPSLDPDELQLALGLAATRQRAFVRDVEGSGTTLLAVSGGGPLRPLYGNGSAHAHRSSGAVELNRALGIRSLRDDVDDLDAAFRAVATGRAPRTRAVLDQYSNDSTVRGTHLGVAV